MGHGFSYLPEQAELCLVSKYVTLQPRDNEALSNSSTDQRHRLEKASDTRSRSPANLETPDDESEATAKMHRVSLRVADHYAIQSPTVSVLHYRITAFEYLLFGIEFSFP